MPTLNLLNSITPTGDWLTDPSAPYDMQPYDYSQIAANVVLDALNPIIEITNIPSGAMIADAPSETPPYISSIIEEPDFYKFIFEQTYQPTVIDMVPYQYEPDFILTKGDTNSSYNNQTKVLTFTFTLIHTSLLNPPLSNYTTTHTYYFDLSSIYYDNNIILGECSYYSDGNAMPYVVSFAANEIQSSYSVVSTDIANRKATIRVDKSIENLAPPLNRLFLRFDKTP